MLPLGVSSILVIEDTFYCCIGVVCIGQLSIGLHQLIRKRIIELWYAIWLVGTEE